MAKALTISSDTSWILVGAATIVASVAFSAYLFLVVASVPAQSAPASRYNLSAISELNKPASNNVFARTTQLAPPVAAQDQVTYSSDDLGKTSLGQ